MFQRNKISDLKIPYNQKDFVSERAKVQYIGNCTRPDLSAPAQLLANSSTDPSIEDINKLSKLIKYCHSTFDVGLNFVPLDQDSVRLVLFTDASFANAKDWKSQIGFVLIAVDKDMNANIVHYGSSRCKRVARSVMAAEIHGLTYGWDNAYIGKTMLEEILGKEIKIDVYVDSKTLFNIITKYSTTMEKRLQIDVAAIRESAERRELNRFGWIPGTANPADALTKETVKNSNPLRSLLNSNRLFLDEKGASFVQA